ncbi:hypothetical protein C2E25_17085, partial [Geothermobacter hydrogeniphilus]
LSRRYSVEVTHSIEGRAKNRRSIQGRFRAVICRAMRRMHIETVGQVQYAVAGEFWCRIDLYPFQIRYLAILES